MKIRSITAALFILSFGIAGAVPTPAPPVHHAISATCLPSFNADPKTYDNLDAKAHFTCFDGSFAGGCSSGMAVWWNQPPAAIDGPRFRYECALTANTMSRPACQTGFQWASYSDPLNAGVKYSCTSAVVTCPAGFALNAGDPDWFGYKEGGFLYKCTKSG
jgi:hypothetical protein